MVALRLFLLEVLVVVSSSMVWLEAVSLTLWREEMKLKVYPEERVEEHHYFYRHQVLVTSNPNLE